MHLVFRIFYTWSYFGVSFIELTNEGGETSCVGRLDQSVIWYPQQILLLQFVIGINQHATIWTTQNLFKTNTSPFSSKPSSAFITGKHAISKQPN